MDETSVRRFGGQGRFELQHARRHDRNEGGLAPTTAEIGVGSPKKGPTSRRLRLEPLAAVVRGVRVGLALAIGAP